ncbi:PREDICTED: melanoma-associated antigen B1-like [Elephantulus edwardii]|uniref:melanoma-associated antigen B1-like n=1 Tax=Elephantulus edwardii TaxID=28737 RepID=UPI0003F0A7DE|nr:PREDICTED: melanoma-associated antigen B1-like [Elephantulus edwardii]
MPRGRKTKLRAKKYCQARGQSQSLQGAQASLDFSPETEGTPQSSSTAGSPQEPVPGPSTQGAALAGGAAQAEGASLAGAAALAGGARRSRPRARKDRKGEKNGADEGSSSENTGSSRDVSPKNPFNTRACLLMQLMLHKYKMDELITKEEMLKTITRKYSHEFPEILKVTTKRLELAFGIYLTEQHPGSHVYSLVSKLNLPSNPTASGQRELPKTGLLMPLLGMIFINGNRATEKELWKFLNKLGIYVGQHHLIFGEPKKLISDFVQAKYLEHRLLPGYPPRYEFVWGPRAYAQTSKMEVLAFLAKVNGTSPSDFKAEYEEALAEEEEKARAKGAAEAGPAAPEKVKGAGSSTP